MNAHSPSPRAVAAHVLVALARAQARGLAVDSEALARAIGVRKLDLRAVVTKLHDEGHIDATRMRLTLSGLAIATALRGQKLPALRTRRAVVAAAA